MNIFSTWPARIARHLIIIVRRKWRRDRPIGFLRHSPQTSCATGSAAIPRLSRLGQEKIMETTVLSSGRFDVYRSITEIIIAAIEAGAGAFVMPWHQPDAPITRPQNAYTRMSYHGINVIALWAQAYQANYRSGYWASYRQWKELGAQVQVGSKSSTVVFFKRLDEDSRQENDPEPRVRLVARASRVFNADQVIGWVAPEKEPVGDPVEVVESVAAFVAATEARIHHSGHAAYYDIWEDHVVMPAPERFRGSPTSTPTEAYYATLLHELTHWAGAPHRLGRFAQVIQRKEDVAREELVAELGAAYLCADLGLTNEPRPDHAAYVSSWLEILRADKRAIFAAARQAGEAASYLHELADAPF